MSAEETNITKDPEDEYVNWPIDDDFEEAFDDDPHPTKGIAKDLQNAVAVVHDDNDTAINGCAAGGGFFQDEDVILCDECERRFSDSWLLRQFDCRVCDECRDRDGKHSLITKTDAKNEYFLKDTDFTNREPPLKCVVKKNPHNNNWGEMKLFLRCQVEDRAIEVWGSEEAVEAERERREERREKSKKRTFDKMIKELRMNARSSLGKQVHLNHVHDFESKEEYDKERDLYRKKCKTCDHVNEYEKM